MKINERIRNLREDAEPRITQAEIAEAIGIDRKTYNRYEQGKTEIRIETVIEIAKYFKVSVDYIVGLTDDKTPSKQSFETKKLIRAFNEHPEHQKSIKKLLDIT